MGWMYAIFTWVVIGTYACTIHARSYYPDYDSSDSRYWVPPAPFSEPGHIFGSYSVSDLIPIAADVWHADSLMDAGRRSCRHLESDLSAYLTDVGLNPLIPDGITPIFDGPVTLEAICNVFYVGNGEEKCRGLWDALVRLNRRPDLVEGSLSILLEHKCRRREYPFPDGHPTSLPRRSSLDTVTLRDFNIYDPCSVSGIEKLNNILFAVMDWIGPKFFESITGYYGFEFYGLCEIGRYLLSMEVPDFYRNLTGVLKYPAADILEQFQFFDICALSRIDEAGAEAIGAFKDLLVEFSDLNEADFCSFIASGQTRESYLEQGETIVSSIFNLRHDEQSCNNVLDIIAPFDEFGYFHLITGYDPSNDVERSEFCSLFVQAYDPSSTYTPTPYELPTDGPVGSPFAEDPGVVFPGLTFIDLVKIDGAAERGPKVIDGIVVYCDVFEELINSITQPGEGDIHVGAVCNLIRARNLTEAERMCILSHRTGGSRNYNRPLWLRPFNAMYEGIYMLHQISGIMDISKEEVCSAADSLLDGVSVIHLVDQALDIILTEVLPYANLICKSWEEAICYWKPFCPVSEEPTTGYHWYRPSAEEKQRRNAEFDRIVSFLTSLGSTLTGSDGREETCAFIAEAIDPLSGRTDRVFAERMRQQIVGVLTDVDRCSRSVETGLDFIPVRYIFPTTEITSVIHQLTGFDTSRELCQAVAESFARPGGATPPPPPTPGGRLAATYNIIANIAVHVQRVARSI